MKIQRKAELLSEKTFLGFPSADFEKAGPSNYLSCY
jgi:hypothetical protein